ncbi:MAG: adenylyltransferase/cytidyltransferase family protein [Nanoarchaeota archaeon]|nr:adenylyltransferase/cytidyltransferase family protein [Nanoarchaeota archaeon]
MSEIIKEFLITPEILAEIGKQKSMGKKIGFACGVFDLFHAGHVIMLKECKQHCDFLIMAINNAENFSSEINPGKKKPIYTYEQRVMIMKNSRFVDLVLGYSSEEELLYLLKNLQIDVRFLGDDYRGKPITGADPKIKIHYTDRSHGLSTSLYREKS